MKEVLQITITKAKSPTSKLGKWWYWKIYWPIFKVWKPRMLAKIYGALAIVALSLLPKAEREEALKEFQNIEVTIKDENKDE
jgi:hypothetical protein